MKRRFLLVALAMVAAPLSAAMAQTPDAPALRMRGGPAGDGIGLLLEQREELALTADQVTRLESIQAELSRTNAPLLAQLGDVAGPRPGGRGGAGRTGPLNERPDSAQMESMRERRAELEPVMRELRENTQVAMQEALAVLTPEQREEVRSLIEPRRAGPGLRGGPGGPAGARPPRPDRSAI